MRTVYSGSRKRARQLMIDRMVASGWPEAEATARVDDLVGHIPPAVKLVRFDRRAAENAGSFTDGEWQAIVRLYGRCLRCDRSDVPLVPDHIVSLFNGGSHFASNIQPLCGPCNLWKGQRAIDYRHLGPATPVAEDV